MKDCTKLPKIMVLITSIAIMVCVFIPYIKPNQEYRDYLLNVINSSDPSDFLYYDSSYEDAGFSAKEMLNVSLFDCFRIEFHYFVMAISNKDSFSAVVNFFIAFTFVSPVLFSILAILFSKMKTRGGFLVLLQSLLIEAFYFIVKEINKIVLFVSENTMMYMVLGYGSVWGPAHYLYQPLTGLLFLFSIWLWIAKKIYKKRQLTSKT